MIQVESTFPLTEEDVEQALINYLREHKNIDLPNDTRLGLVYMNGTQVERVHYSSIKAVFRYAPPKKLAP